MEKINKEELMKKFEMSDADLETITAGSGPNCLDTCDKPRSDMRMACFFRHPETEPDYEAARQSCYDEIGKWFNDCMVACLS